MAATDSSKQPPVHDYTITPPTPGDIKILGSSIPAFQQYAHNVESHAAIRTYYLVQRSTVLKVFPWRRLQAAGRFLSVYHSTTTP